MTDFNILNKAVKIAWTPLIKSGTVASWKISTRFVYNLMLKNFFVTPTAETKILKHDSIP